MYPSDRFALTMPQRLRLLLSYQRYTVLLALAAAACFGLPSLLWPRAWRWWLAPMAVLALTLSHWAWLTARQWPRKLRATRLALRRMHRGSWHPTSVASLCDTACGRVVADEILRWGGLVWRDRRKLVNRLARERRRAPLIIEVRRHDGVASLWADGEVITSNPF